jgi:hypothetical protein
MHTNNMKTSKFLEFATWTIVAISALGTLSVSLTALLDPAGVMALVHTPLDNTDAFSSIRGVFGGVGITLAAAMVWIFRRDRTAAMGFLAMFWGQLRPVPHAHHRDGRPARRLRRSMDRHRGHLGRAVGGGVRVAAEGHAPQAHPRHVLITGMG